MQTRRQLLKQGACLGGSLLLGAGPAHGQTAPPAVTWRMPDEGERHRSTWMAFGPSADVWGERLQQGAQVALARIANAIARFEPVNMLVRESDMEVARSLCGHGIHLIEQPIDDLWLRDTGAVLVADDRGDLAAIDFNFNGWGGKQAHPHDAEVAGFMADYLDLPVLETSLILEGGGIEVDGEGTAIITESCVLNPNRNPGLSKADCERSLRQLLGVKKVIWLPGIAGKDITDGHTDFYARFARPGLVIAALEPDPQSYEYALTRTHLDILRRATDARGRKLQVETLQAPSRVRPRYANDEFAAGYVNFYLVNGAVIAPEFGDRRADGRAKDKLQQMFPDREVVMLDIDVIAAGGGGIHCATQQEPWVSGTRVRA